MRDPCTTSGATKRHTPVDAERQKERGRRSAVILGNVVKSGLDISGDDSLTDDSTDRFTSTETKFEEEANAWWRETTRTTFNVDDSAGTYTTTTQATRLTGFTSPVTAEETYTGNYYRNGGAEPVATEENGTITKTDRNAKQVTQETTTSGATGLAIAVTLNGLLVSSTSSSGIESTYGYDGFGRQTTVTDGRGNITTTHYNALNQVDYVETEWAPEQFATTTYGYHPDSGQLMSVGTPQPGGGHDYTYYAYTARGEIEKIWGDVPQPVLFSYDGFAQREKMTTFRGTMDFTGDQWPGKTESDGDTTTWVYDPATGLLTDKIYADGKETSYTFYADGKLHERLWAREDGQSNRVKTTYTYDPDTDELMTVTYSDTAYSPDLTFAYTRSGQLASVTAADPKATDHIFNYSAWPEEVTETTSGLYSKTITRTFDPSAGGRPDSLSIGAGYSVTYSYDPSSGRMNRITGPGLPAYGAVYEYLMDGSQNPTADLVHHIDFRSDASTTIGRIVRDYEGTRDLIDHVTNTWDPAGTPVVVSKYDYTNDVLGRRTNIEYSGSAFAATVSQSFGYNPRNELTDSARADVGDWVYAYDTIGNRETADGPLLGPKAYVPSELNQYASIASGSPALPRPLFHDADGNLISDDASQQYEYNTENRLVAVTGSGVIFVDAARASDGDGSSWANAYKYLQSALDKASRMAGPVEIWVADGTYYPDEGTGQSNNDRSSTFLLANNVTILGGFAGASDPGVRDPLAYPTVLSGDLDQNDCGQAQGQPFGWHGLLASAAGGWGGPWADVGMEAVGLWASRAYAKAVLERTVETVVRDWPVAKTASTPPGEAAIKAAAESTIEEHGAGTPSPIDGREVASLPVQARLASYAPGIEPLFLAALGQTVGTNGVDSGTDDEGPWAQAQSGTGGTDDTTGSTGAGTLGGELPGMLDGGGAAMGYSQSCCTDNKTYNAYHVVTADGVDATAVLDGVTISGGYADGTNPDHIGGGIRCDSDGSPTIRNCIIECNYASNGGGVMARYGAAPALTGCTIRHNWSAAAGGIANYQATSTLTDCTFYQNTGGTAAAGLQIGESDPVVVRCTFEENTSASYGGATYSWGSAAPSFIDCTFLRNQSRSGGAVSTSGAQPTVINSRLLGNQAVYGGGAFVSGSGGLLTLTNCIFSGNAVSGEPVVLGGGLCVVGFGTADVTNCTFSGNTATAEDAWGGGVYVENATATIANAIAWGNSANGSTAEFAQIYKWYFSTFSLSYSCVQNWTAGGLGGTGNIDDDPLLADADGYDDTAGTADDDLHLLSTSPCEDVGDNAAVPLDVLDLDGNGDKTEATPLDLDRFARFQGTGPVVDMGAYEYAVRDCNSNQTADHVDIAVGTSDDCNANAVPDECELSAGTATDCDVNSTLDECDLMAGDALDCNENGLPDSCDIASGTSQDSNQNGTPDECEEIPLPYRVEYGYDYMGRKVRRQTFDWDPAGEEWDGPAQDTKYVYNGWTVVEELDGNDSDALTRQYTWGLDLAAQAGSVNSLEQAGGIGGLLAAYDTAGTTSTADDRTFLYLYDANGNVGQLVETTTGQRHGTVQAHYEYTPYGQVLIETIYEQPYRFSTKPFDLWTGLGYWGYRHYSPKLGRWMTRDPLGERGGMNLSQYAGGDPLTHIDPLGLEKAAFKEAKDAINAIHALHAGKFYYEDSMWLTGLRPLLFDKLWWALDKLGEGNVKYGRTGGAAAKYYDIVNDLVLDKGNRGSTDMYTIFHELIHVYNDFKDYDDARKDEGVAYAAQYMAQALERGMIRFDNEMKSDRPNEDVLRRRWSGAWYRIGDVLGLTGAADGTNFQISTSDVNNVANHLGFKLRCTEFARLYNRLADEKGLCMNFFCTISPAEGVVAGGAYLAKPLDPVFGGE